MAPTPRDNHLLSNKPRGTAHGGRLEVTLELGVSENAGLSICWAQGMNHTRGPLTIFCTNLSAQFTMDTWFQEARESTEVNVPSCVEAGGTQTHTRTYRAHPHRLPSPAPLDSLKQPLFPFASLCLDSCSACTAVYSGDHEIMTDPFGRQKACEKGRGE